MRFAEANLRGSMTDEVHELKFGARLYTKMERKGNMRLTLSYNGSVRPRESVEITEIAEEPPRQKQKQAKMTSFFVKN